MEVLLPFDPESESYNGGESGNCYAAAFTVALRHSDDPSLRDFRVCHGVATCSPGGEAPGSRICHAWCEFDLAFELEGELLHAGTMVVDASNVQRQTCVLPMAMYYAVGRIDPQAVRRYTPREAFDLGCKTGHCGRWERPLEALDNEDKEQSGWYDDEGLFHVSGKSPVDPRDIEGFREELRDLGML